MTHIWVPKVKIIEPKDPLKVSGRLAGEYTLRKYKAGTDQLIQQIGPFENLITDAGLNRMGTGAPIDGGNCCFVGTGSAAPATTDTQLQSFFVQSNSFQVWWAQATERGGSPTYFVRGAGTWRFDAGAFNNTNLTEVGVGWFDPDASNPSANHRCFSRALIVDGLGSPTTITLLPDEYLDVTYSAKFYPYLGSDVVQTVNISGVSYTFTSRSCGVNSNYTNLTNAFGDVAPPILYTGTAAGTAPSLGAVTDDGLTNAGAADTAASVSMVSYVNNSNELSANFTWSLMMGNLAYGVRGLTWESVAGSIKPIVQRTQTTISPAIPKDSTKILSFGLTFSWDRY